MRRKNRFTVRDNRIRDAVQANDIIEEQTCELGRVSSFETRDKMTHLRKAVDEDKERIVPIREGVDQ